MECNHKNIKNTTLTKEFQGNTFKIEGLYCSDCGGEIWNKEMSKSFHNWLVTLEFDNTKQYSLSEDTNVVLQEFMKNINCEDEGQLVRSIIAVMNARLNNKICESVFQEIMESEDFKKLEEGKLDISKKVRITKAKTFYDFEVWRDIAGMKDSEMIRTEIMLILVMSKRKNAKFAKFWDEHFKEYLDIALSA